jgi:hypothetical protein
MGYKYLSKVSIFFLFIFISLSSINAQEGDSLLQKRIRNQQYVFVPLSFSSYTVTMPTLTRDFEFRVTIDSLIAILPFFGQSYSQQFGGALNENGINFISTNFDYTAVEKKKSKWEITIKPKDTRGIQIFLTVFNNGNAQMQVINPRKETMILSGYVW